MVTQQDWLTQQWQQAVNKSSSCLLVIDEIQKVPNWSERIKALWDDQKVKRNQKIKLVLLGSSSLKIQQGLTESLTGRYELLRAFHWSFEESQIIRKITFSEYLIYGGYPGSYRFIGNAKRFDAFIKNSIISSVIEKDLLNESRIRNPALFKQTFQLLRVLPAAESQKRKSSKSVPAFLREFKNAKIVYVNFENYGSFALDPQAFLLKMISLT